MLALEVGSDWKESLEIIAKSFSSLIVAAVLIVFPQPGGGGGGGGGCYAGPVG